MHIDQDLADVLTEQFNSYACMMEELNDLEVEWVLAHLELFHVDDLRFLIEDDFGRGLVMGALHTIYIQEAIAREISEQEQTEES